MNTLTKDQLRFLKKGISALVQQSISTRNKLWNEGKITELEINEIENKENVLQRLFEELNWAMLKETINTDLEEPGQKIMTATNNVNAAITQLEDINKFIGILGTFINIASTIIMAFSPLGTPLQLTNLLGEIQNLLES
jgi:hypothetical protein